MGIMSSTVLKHVHSNPRSQNNRFPSEKLGDPLNDWQDQLHVFMKQGPCKESFMAFQDCVEEAEKNEESTSKCFPALGKCMESHSDYHQPCFVAMKATIEMLTNTVMPSMDFRVSDDEKDEIEKRFEEFLQGDNCKESLRAWLDCTEEAEKNHEDSIIKCARTSQMLSKCMDAHPDSYQPYFQLVKSGEEHMGKELQAFFSKST